MSSRIEGSGVGSQKGLTLGVSRSLELKRRCQETEDSVGLVNA